MRTLDASALLSARRQLDRVYTPNTIAPVNEINCKPNDPAAIVSNAANTALRKAGHFLNEAEFRDSLLKELVSLESCKRECPAVFGPASVSAPKPPPPFQPKDVCEVRGYRKVDLVAKLDSEFVAIELKFSRLSNWKGSFREKPLPNPTRSDVVAYGFLKDIHRMERLTKVVFGAQCVVPRYRVCALLSNNQFETENRNLHERMHLRSRTLPAEHLVQFNEWQKNRKPTSPNTLWRDYPPFRLAQSYVLSWQHIDVDPKNFTPAANERRPYPPFQLLVVNVSFVGEAA